MSAPKSLFQFIHRAKALLQQKPHPNGIYIQNADMAPAGTNAWVAKVERLLRDIEREAE